MSPVGIMAAAYCEAANLPMMEFTISGDGEFLGCSNLGCLRWPEYLG